MEKSGSKRDKHYYTVLAFVFLTTVINTMALIYACGLSVGFLLFFSINIAIVCAFYYFLNKSQNTKQKTFMAFLALAFLVFSIFFNWFSISISSLFRDDNTAPLRINYSTNVHKMTDKTYRIKHFPINIPNEAKNYHLFIENNFDGYNIHHLSFKTNKEYINKAIKNNQDNIDKEYTPKDINKYYRHIPYDEIKDMQNSKIYIMKNEKNDNDYTSGIITSDSGEIIFFYANFSLQDN